MKKVVSYAIFCFLLSMPFYMSVAGKLGAWSSCFFVVEIQTEQSGVAQIYWDSGLGENEELSQRLPLKNGNGFRTYRFPLPISTFKGLRFDPNDRESACLIRNAHIIGRQGIVFKSFPPESFIAANQISELVIQGKELFVRTVKDANDPILIIQSEYPLKPNYSKLIWLYILYVCCTLVMALGLILGLKCIKTKMDQPISSAGVDVLALLLCFALLLFLNTLARLVVTGDTIELIEGSERLVNCLRDGILSKCHGVAHFPLMQTIPAALMNVAGFSQETTLTVFALSSCISFCGLFLVYYLLFRTEPVILLIAWLVLITSPLLAYARDTLNEVNAAFFTVLFVQRCIRNNARWSVLVTFWIAGVTKETAWPFLLLLGLTSVSFGGLKALLARKDKIAFLVSGCLLVVLTNSFFNHFRYGSIFNLPYLNPGAIAPNWGQVVSSGAAIWISLQGGLLTFWFSFTVPALWCFSSFMLKFIRSPRSDWGWPQSFMILLILSGLTLGFGMWWSPFGWMSYGQRLILPWLPAIFALIALSMKEPLIKLFAIMCSNRLLYVTVCILLIVISLPHMMTFVDWPLAWHYAFDMTYWGVSEHFNPDGNPMHSEIFYRNINLVMWAPDSLMYEVLRRSLPRQYLWPWILSYAFVVGVLLQSIHMRLTMDLRANSNPS